MFVIVHGFCLLRKEQDSCSIFTLHASGAVHPSPALTHTISAAHMPLGYTYVARLLVPVSQL